MRNIWTPFTYFNRRNFIILIAIQVVIAVVCWISLDAKWLPTPFAIAQEWQKLVQNQGLIPNLIESVRTSLISLVLAAAFSTLLVFLSTAPLFWPLAKFMSAMRFLGFAGLTYIFTLLTNNGDDLKIGLLTFGMTVFMTTNLLAEVKSIPQSSIDHCRTMDMQGWRISYELLLRGKLDVILDLLRQNAAVGWTLLTMVEGLVRSSGGIGVMLLNQNRYFNLAGVFAIQITILLYGLLQDWFLGWLRYTVCPYLTNNNK
ncbi:nitrate ABC transporter permease [Serratia sp. S1B]|nr:nitrate ABC transporter permease [Serratia sp. S1B]